MPRLDGFGLLEEMKRDPRLARIPVIIVSSLERREDQERGLSLGPTPTSSSGSSITRNCSTRSSKSCERADADATDPA